MAGKSSCTTGDAICWGRLSQVHSPIIDCFCLLDHDQVHRYFDLDYEVKSMKRAYIQRLKEAAYYKQNLTWK